MKTQMIVMRYRRQIPQGAWKYQQRGCESLVAWPASIDQMPDIRSACVRESSRREGALFAHTGKNVIRAFGRRDAERDFGPLIQGIGGDCGPWLTFTPCPGL